MNELTKQIYKKQKYVNKVHVILPVVQISDRLLSCLQLAENQVIQEIEAQTHTLIASEATRPLKQDHLLLDQSLGSHSAVMFEISCKKSNEKTIY